MKKKKRTRVRYEKGHKNKIRKQRKIKTICQFQNLLDGEKTMLD